MIYIFNKSMNITGLFPVPLGVKNLNNIMSEKEINYINKLKETSEKNIAGNSISMNKYVLEKEELENLKKHLENYINEYFHEVFKPNESVNLYITTSWINWTENGENHFAHFHPNSVISGVLYIDTSDEDVIAFINPCENIFGNITSFSNDTTKWNAQLLGIPVIKNQLFLFPSTLKHNVPRRPNTSKGTRTSLSFNTFIRGKVGQANSTDELILK